MTLTDIRSRAGSALDRLLDALDEPVRRDLVMLLLLLGYCAVWALYGTIAKGSQDLHFDMGEMVAWSREVGFGTVKHPPLGAWLVGAWFSVFPLADWSYYLFAMALATVSLRIAWLTAGPYLDGDKRVVGIALLTLVPFFNFHALKYNANTVMMPLWAFATFTFLRSFETRSIAWALLAGVAAAAAMLGKYWSVMLLAGLGLAALADPRRGAYFRSAAPWVTIAAGLVALSPHLVWLYANDFAPFAYATSTHPGTFAEAMRSAFAYPAGAIAYVALPLIIVAVATRPTAAALADTAWPGAPERRLVVLAFVLPLLLPAVVAIASGTVIVSLWAIGAMTLLPVVLLSSPRIALSRPMARRILGVALAFPLVALAVSPIVALVIHRQGVPNRATHYRGLALTVERLWRQTTDAPLRIVGSYDNLVYGTVPYFADRPSTLEIVTPRLSPWIDAARIDREGIAVYCPVEEMPCLRALAALLSERPLARWSEVRITRTHLRHTDAPDRFVIAIVPPAH